MGKKSLLFEDRNIRITTLQKTVTCKAQIKALNRLEKGKECDLAIKIKTGQLNRQERRCIRHRLKADAKGDRVALNRALAWLGIY